MMDTINPILQWLNQHPNWASLATFIIAAGESVAIIGTIVPGTIMMTAIGTLAGANVIPLIPTLICAILGAIVGDGISYLIGKHFKDRIRSIWPFRNNPQWLAKGERFFHKHGGTSVFIGRFVGPVRAIVPVIAGMLGMKPLKFYIANVTSAIGWAPAYMLPGIILGSISLELPPDIAVHIILMLLLVSLLTVFAFWIVFKVFAHIGYRIDRGLNSLWKRLKNSKYARYITIVLKHYNEHKTHGQLVLAFYLIFVAIGFFWLAHYIAIHGSTSNFFNNSLYHFFRSLRTPLLDNIALMLTLLGEKRVIIPVMLLVFAWLIATKRQYLAWHILILGIVAVLSVELAKHLVHSPRPWGIEFSNNSYSFPSGHTTLATIFYIGLALLISQSYPNKRRYFVYVAILIALLVSISRLYLGAHWFTDVLAGWLLGAMIIMLITISYNRQRDHQRDFGKIASITTLIFICSYVFTYCYSFHRYEKQYTLIDYPKYTLTSDNWWKDSTTHTPLYRINRLGLESQVLNLQWIGNLNNIQETLVKNGWSIPPTRNWISVILRIADIKSSENLPLVPLLHLDKQPVLVLVKPTYQGDRVMVLRLWDSNIVIKPEQQPLWVGTVSIIPRTYNWLFKKKSDEITINADLIFTKETPIHYEVKKISLPPSNTTHKSKLLPTILLLKPKS